MDNKGLGKLWGIADAIEDAVREILDREIIFWSKKDLSPVSNIDIAIQDIIITLILSNYREHNIICEEGDIKYGNGNSVYSWIIDPIDGTDNFIRGKKEFGISIGLMQGNEFVEALLLFPRLGESYYAARNHGIWKNGLAFLPDRLVQNKRTKEVILCSKTVENFRPVFESAGYLVRFYRCATYSLLMVLKNKAFMYHTVNTMIYDVGPMAFILREASIRSFNQGGIPLLFSADKSIIPFFMALSDEKAKDAMYLLLSSNQLHF